MGVREYSNRSCKMLLTYSHIRAAGMSCTAPSSKTHRVTTMHECPSKALNIHWMIGNGRRPHNTNCLHSASCIRNAAKTSNNTPCIRDQFTLNTSSMVSHLEHTRKITRSGQRKNISSGVVVNTRAHTKTLNMMLQGEGLTLLAHTSN